MKQLQLSDFLHYKFLSAPEWAPDGKHAAFVVTVANEEENGYESRLYLYTHATGETRQLTDLGKESSFFWLDSTHLLFPAVRSAAEKKRAEKKDVFTSYYCLDITGGEALPAFTLPFAAQRVKVLDSTHLAVLGSISARHPDFYAADDEGREAVLKEIEENKDYEVLEEIPFWFNGAGMLNRQRTALFLVRTDTMDVRRVTGPKEDVGAMAVLGDEIFYVSDTVETKPHLTQAVFKAVNWRTEEERELARHEPLTVSDLIRVGNEVWVLAHTAERHGMNENDWIYRLDTAAGSLEIIRKEEGALYGFVGSDCRYGGGKQQAEHDGALYSIAAREGDAILVRIDAGGDRQTVLGKPGSLDCIALTGEHDTALAVAMYDMKLQELYAVDLKTGELRQLTHFNDDALKDIYVAQPKYLETQSEGLTIGGWVLLPRDYDPAKRYPAVFDIHGGPKTTYGTVFYHEMQYWANLGYFVFFCNPKGSDGRDNEFMDIFGHYGETDYKNLMDFTDAVLQAWPQIDPARVCETGGSYGGFMTNWIIGHTDRFCCAASQRSIANWLGFYGTSDIGWCFVPDQTKGSLADPATMWRQSPLAYADQVKTPTLFIHSDEDYRCPLPEGLQMFTALVDRGVPARLCMFHGENHELSRAGKPKHRIRRLKEITDWFNHYADKEE